MDTLCEGPGMAVRAGAKAQGVWLPPAREDRRGDPITWGWRASGLPSEKSPVLGWPEGV